MAEKSDVASPAGNEAVLGSQGSSGSAPEVPSNMRVVTKEEFFAFMNPLDVYPNNLNPNFSSWELRDRRVVGRSYPGRKNPGDAKAYMLTHEARAALSKATA